VADSITIDVDSDHVEWALRSLGDVAQPFINEGSAETAAAIAREAEARLERQVGHAHATKSRPDLGQGRTEKGIVAHPAYDGNGSIVIALRDPYPSLPFWLEKGTEHMDARPFFYPSVALEVNTHQQRMQDALEQAIEALGE
jgi:hypothetical protein